MKKTALKSAALLSSVIVSGVAMAQATNVDPAAAKKEDAAKTVIPYGLFQTYVNIHDSQRQNTPDFTAITARFGLKVTEGIVRGQIETQVLGPHKFDLNRYSSSLDAAPAESNNGIVLRRADVGLVFPTDTSVYFGRVRPGGADGWGVDASATPDQYGASDGVLLVQKIAISEGNSVDLKLAALNDLGVYRGADVSTRNQTNDEFRALLAGVNANVAGVKAALFYQWKKDQLSAVAKPAVDDDAATADVNEAKAEVRETVNDRGHLEASLGYDTDGIGGGVWYQRHFRGKRKEVESNQGGNKKIRTAIAPENVQDNEAVSAYNLGVGVNGDSSLFGVTDLLMTGDKLTFGASYVFKEIDAKEANRGKAVGSAIDLGGYDFTEANGTERNITTKSQYEIAVGGGYAVGGALFELGFVNRTADEKVFSKRGKRNGANPRVVKDSNEVYLTGIYSF